jgi:SlyX protein
MKKAIPNIHQFSSLREYRPYPTTKDAARTLSNQTVHFANRCALTSTRLTSGPISAFEDQDEWPVAARRLPMSDETSRITQLEETVAHQTKAIEELSDQLTEQWKVVEQTRAKLDRLTERFLSLEEQSLEAPAATRPPHY